MCKNFSEVPSRPLLSGWVLPIKFPGGGGGQSSLLPLLILPPGVRLIFQITTIFPKTSRSRGSGTLYKSQQAPGLQLRPRSRRRRLQGTLQGARLGRGRSHTRDHTLSEGTCVGAENLPPLSPPRGSSFGFRAGGVIDTRGR